MNVAYSRAVRSFLIRESTYDSSTKSRLYDALLAVAQETASPGHWRCLSQVAGARELFANVETDFPNSCAVALQRAVMDMDDQSLAELSGSVPKTRLEMYRGRVALESGDTAAAGKFFGAAASATFVADQLAAALGAVETRERDENLIGALEVVCDIVSRIPSAWRQFDIADLLQRIEGHCLETAYRSIELPTAHEIYSRHLSTDRDAQKADAAEEYVLSRGVERPSEIDTSSVSAGKLIPFLRDVCTPRTLDPFMALGDASAVELERIAICQVLTEIDSDNSSTYADEIRRITRRRIVRARLKQVEKSKIFVDVGNVKRQAEKRLREQFARFQELLSRPDYDRSFMKLISNVREIIGDSETLVHIADMPTDEREQSFRKLCSEVFALLLTSQEHGFKTYLSTRIKHGTLAAQISSSLSMNHLLLEANDGTFVRNGFWRDQLDLNVVEDDALHAVSERFSRQINEIISKLKNDWIQIKGDEHAEAWLDFSFFRTQILFLQSQIDEQTSFDEFFDIVLERFWKALDSNLATVRGRLDREIKPMLADELNAFESHAQAALPSVENLTPLWSAIAAARTDVQNSLDVIISWFRLTQSAERPDYDFGVAVDVAIESINSCFRARPINLTREGNVAKEMAGSTLESIVDILFILFENAITHSQSLLGPDVRLRVEAGDDMLLLEVENSVSESVASSIDNEALRAHLDDLRSDSSRAMVSREGGSGFPKIVKIIRHDLNAENSISAQLVDDNIFRIGLSIESPGLFV